jgi:FMN phosphatase YigB (HAD superfamily)
MKGSLTYSFDVFETVIIRAVSPPEAVFFWLALELREEFDARLDAAAFARARMEAEVAAFKKLGPAYTLADIYETMSAQERLMLSTRELCDREEEMELKLACPVPSAVKEVQRLHAEGNQVVFVSDTYLPKRIVSRMLHKVGALVPGAQVHVSNEHGVFKIKGRLFQKLSAMGALGQGPVLHTGNSHEADVRGARRAGIPARYSPEGNSNEDERTLENGLWDVPFLSSILAGSSKRSRLESDSSPVQRIASDVAAPTLLLFLLWIIRQTREKGIGRVYFLARDGYLLHRMALLGQHAGWFPDMEFRYLAASRRSWLLPIHGLSALGWLFDNFQGMNLKRLAARLGIDVEDILEALPARVVDERTLSVDEVKGLLDLPRVEALVEARVLAERTLLHKYFDQEGLFDREPSVVVDIGWRGTLHEALCACLAERKLPPVQGLYFGLDDVESGAFASQRHALFDAAHFPGFPAGRIEHSVKFIVESFTVAPQGSVSGFRRADSRIVPVQEALPFEPLQKWGIDTVHRAILDCWQKFLQHASPACLLGSEIECMKKPVGDILRRFANHPTREDADAWGSLPTESGQGAENVESLDLAPRLTHRDLLHSLRTRRLPASHDAAWVHGSITRSSWPVRVAFSFLLALRRRRS